VDVQSFFVSLDDAKAIKTSIRQGFLYSATYWVEVFNVKYVK